MWHHLQPAVWQYDSQRTGCMQHAAAHTCNALNSCTRVKSVPDGLHWAADLELGEALRELQLPEVAVGLLQAAPHVAPRGCRHLPGVRGGPPRAAAQAALSQHQLLPGSICQPATTTLRRSLYRQLESHTIMVLEEQS